MQQSVRMVAAMFLTEFMRISWVEGARWFHDNLVDADLQINTMMWQNAGKAGLDQWNFTMSPVSKAQDPTGAYIRKWVPELAKLSTKSIFEPWKASEDDLLKAGVVLGRTYPLRLVTDVDAARKSTTASIREARSRAMDWSDEGGYDLIDVPPGSMQHGTFHQPRIRVFTLHEYKSATAPSVGAKMPRAPRAGAAGGAGGGRGRGRSNGGGGRGSKQQNVAAGAPTASRPPNKRGAGRKAASAAVQQTLAAMWGGANTSK